MHGMSCRRKRDSVFVLQHYDTTIVRLRKRPLHLPPAPLPPRPPAGPAAPALVPVPRGSRARPKTGCQTVPKQANSCQIAPRVPGSWPLATDSAAFPGPRHTRHLTYIQTAAVLVKYSRNMTLWMPTLGRETVTPPRRDAHGRRRNRKGKADRNIGDRKMKTHPIFLSSH